MSDTIGYSKYTKYLLVLIDLVLLNLCLFLVMWIWHPDIYLSDLRVPFFAFNLLWVLVVLILHPYHENRITSFLKEIRSVLPVLIGHFFIVLIFNTLNQAFPPWSLLILFALILLGLLISRIILVYAFTFYRKKGFNYRTVIIYGHGELSKQLIDEFERHKELGYRCLGVFDDKNANDGVLGSKSELKKFAVENGIDGIYCCLPDIEYKDLKEILDFGDDNFINIKLISDLRSTNKNGFEVEMINNLTALNLSSIPLDDIDNRMLKRLFDIVFSAFVILFILSWIYPLVAIFVKIDSSGPILFKQKRTGHKNKEFTCLKFRTMKVNTEADSKQAEKDDNRVTNIGRFLRNSSIDELPQFVNVLFGDMSVVGPRPHMISHTHEYSKVINKYMSRHNVKPGVTGLAQVKGFRGETKQLHKMEGRIRYDKTYIESWSLLLDIKIILITIFNVIIVRNED